MIIVHVENAEREFKGFRVIKEKTSEYRYKGGKGVCKYTDEIHIILFVCRYCVKHISRLDNAVGTVKYTGEKK